MDAMIVWEMTGYIGLIAFALAWIPQTVETVRRGRCDANTTFLWLSALGSVSLVAYSLLRRDAVFAALNTMTTIGALVNAYYRMFPSRAR